jgi:hypothetical protein
MRNLFLVFAALWLAAGCASVVNPFTHLTPDYSIVPENALRAVAVEIETAVAAGDRDVQIQDREGVVVSTPEIQQAIRTRAVRAALVKAFLDSGHACEQRSGMLNTLRSGDYKRSTSKRDRDRNALVVMGENSDRWALYEGIVAASKFPPRARGAVQDAFYRARLEQLGAGQKYEAEDGQIVSK